jgi:hypothetical protein
MGLPSPTPTPAVEELAKHNEDTSSDNNTDVLVAAHGASSPTTTTVGADVEHPLVDTKPEVIPEERDTDDDGYSYYTGAPEPFNELLRPKDAWSSDMEFMQALGRWM